MDSIRGYDDLVVVGALGVCFGSTHHSNRFEHFEVCGVVGGLEEIACSFGLVCPVC